MALDASWSTAVPDWEDRIRDGRSLIPALPLFDAYAEKALRIFKRLKVPDLIGTPTFGEVCEEWVFDLVRTLFGCYDPETKRRLLQEFFLMVPKKNGKSAIAAGIMMTAMILNERPLAEMLLISETQHIARITFNTAAGIVRLDPVLDEKQGGLFRVQESLKAITHLETGAQLKILSADGDVVTGSKAAAVLIDEAHVLGMKMKAPGVYLELRGGLASRPEGFFLQITTQSKVEPAGQFKKELAKARAVRSGEVKAPMLAVLYEFPVAMAKAEAWRDETTWGLVNPNLERSVSVDFLRERYQTALRDGPEALALFASQHLNVEIGLGLHSERWVGADYWPKCAEPGISFASLLERCEVVVAGGDVGGADDLFAMDFLGRERGTRRLLSWAHAWCTSDVLTRRKDIAPKLEDLRDAGDLTIDDDVDAHVREAADLCDQVRAAGLCPDKAAIGLDPWGVAALVDELIRLKFTQDQIFGVGQGFRLNGAIKGLERRLMQKTLIHGDQPIMRWSLENAKAEAKGNNVMITKAKAGTAKIDPLIALFNAAMLMDMDPQPSRRGLDDFLAAPVMAFR